MDISNIREEYTKYGLRRADMEKTPFAQFQKWYRQRTASGVLFHNAVTLATASADGTPSVRTVLLKKADEQGFVFFTNYTSNKAKDMDENPKVSLLFFWPELERQVILKGLSEKISADESCQYFKSRPYASQLGAWASHQSQIIVDRKTLEAGFDKIKRQFMDKEIPCPDFWGGYRVKPLSVEFWQGRTNRMHDRIRYRKNESANLWSMERLSP